MKKIYLDYAASTPVDSQVISAMEPYFSKIYGNPGAIHQFGQVASAAIFKARQTIAKAIGADYKEIIFTGSATEANNLALRGITRKYMQNCAEFFRVSPRGFHKIPRPRLIVSAGVDLLIHFQKC